MTTNTNTNTNQHGGPREGAGRKRRYTKPTVRKVINLPHEFIKALESRHGTLQAALEQAAFSIEPELIKLINTNPTNERTTE